MSPPPRGLPEQRDLPPPPVAVSVSVQPDVTGIDRAFDYLVDPPGELPPGAIVRVPLGARHVRGWVLGPGGGERSEALRSIDRVLSIGPAPDLVELARYGAWRYAGRLRPFLLAASPPRQLPPGAPLPPPARAGGQPRAGVRPGELSEAVGAALSYPLSVLRLPPGGSRQQVVEEVIGRLGPQLLVLCPERRDVELLALRLERAGSAVARQPEEFAGAAAGGRVVLGSRAAAFAPVPALAGVVVLDAHAEAYREERAPTWDATVLVAERARRVGVPCLYVSPSPSVVHLATAELVTLPAAVERAGWPALEVLDRRRDDPRSGLYAPQLAGIIHGALEAEPTRQVVAVLNRTGRARLLSCASCGALVRCEHCGAALMQQERPAAGAPSLLVCPSCARQRPVVCAECSSQRLRSLRVGTGRAREELAALLGVEVAEVSGPRRKQEALPVAPVLVGTEAVLHRARRASLVVFLDFDQELLASRYRAGEQAMALLIRAGRLVGPRQGQGTFVRRVVVQSRLPDHEVLAAASAGEPQRYSEAERARRALLHLPPYSALALLSGEGAGDLEAPLRAEGLEVARRVDGSLLLRAAGPVELAEVLRRGVPSEEGLRLEVDPLSA